VPTKVSHSRIWFQLALFWSTTALPRYATT
jgi:hypothetical protein